METVLSLLEIAAFFTAWFGAGMFCLYQLKRIDHMKWPMHSKIYHRCWCIGEEKHEPGKVALSTGFVCVLFFPVPLAIFAAAQIANWINREKLKPTDGKAAEPKLASVDECFKK